MNQVIAGLDNVIACDTAISHIDGEAGLLIVRGRSVEDVATLGFEHTAALLWQAETAAVRRGLGEARRLAHGRLNRGVVGLADAMDGVRAGLACMGAQRRAFPGDAMEVTGALGVLLGAWAAHARGEEPLAPDPDAAHADDVLRMVIGGAVEPGRARALDVYLCTVAEHGMNASTFAARVAASTEADTLSAVIAGMCALKGRLHGGAPGPVLDMLDAIGQPDDADDWLGGELDAGRRIMGMGHRIYRARDPRAAVLEAACRDLAGSGRMALARHVEQRAEALLAARHPNRALRANVEFFTAVLLEAIGIPRAMFTAVFAAARVAGWCAHVEEQRRTGRLIRPLARYIGPRAT